jgi:hypothetical protein
MAGSLAIGSRSFLILPGPSRSTWPVNKLRSTTPAPRALRTKPVRRSVHEAAHADVHNHAESQECEQYRGSPIAHERKRDAGNRHQPQDHSDVDRDLENEDRCHAHHQERTWQICGCLSVLNQTHQYQKVYQEHKNRADEAVFFAESGKDEVCVRDRQEVALGLGSLIGASSEDAAVADGNFGLQNLIPGAAWVSVGVHEAGETGLLIGLEDLPAFPYAADGEEDDQNEDAALPPVNAAEEQTQNQDRTVGERRSHVGLLENQQHWNSDEANGFENVSPRELSSGKIAEVAGDQNNEHKFDPLGGLEMGSARKFDPALTAIDTSTYGKDGNKTHQTEAVDPVNRAQQLVVVDDRHDEHCDQTASDPENLHPLEAVKFGVEGRAVDFENADHRQEQDEGEQRPVEVAEGEEAAHGITRVPPDGWRAQVTVGNLL